MECYISESEAKAQVSTLATAHSNDFVIYVRKRTTKSPIRKIITYAVVFIYDEKNEDFYDSVLKFNVENDKETKILGSETFLENQKKKEVFFIECLVEVTI